MPIYNYKATKSKQLYHSQSLRLADNTFWRSASGKETWYGKATTTAAKVVGTVAGAIIGGPLGAAAGAALATAVTGGSKLKAANRAGTGSLYTGGMAREQDADRGALAKDIAISAVEGYMAGGNIQGFAQGAKATSQVGIKSSGGITKVATQSGKKIGGFGVQGQNLGSSLAGETITSQAGLQGGSSLIGKTVATNAQQQVINQGGYNNINKLGNELLGENNYGKILDRLAGEGAQTNSFMNSLTDYIGGDNSNLFNMVGDKMFAEDEEGQKKKQNFNNIMNLISTFK